MGAAQRGFNQSRGATKTIVDETSNSVSGTLSVPASGPAKSVPEREKREELGQGWLG